MQTPRELTMINHELNRTSKLNMINHDYITVIKPVSTRISYILAGAFIDDAFTMAPLVSDPVRTQRRNNRGGGSSSALEKRDDEGRMRGGWGMCIRTIPYRLVNNGE